MNECGAPPTEIMGEMPPGAFRFFLSSSFFLSFLSRFGPQPSPATDSDLRLAGMELGPDGAPKVPECCIS